MKKRLLKVLNNTSNLPSDLDFIYFANDFDGTTVPNRAYSDMGSFSAHGTITKNGEGANCYLSNGRNAGNYLIQTLTDARLQAFRAVNSPYTFFMRILQDNSETGGIISCRTSDDSSYPYMIRAIEGYLEVYGSRSRETNFIETVYGHVLKVVINGTNAYCYDLETGQSETIDLGVSSNAMSNQFVTIAASSNADIDEGYLDRWYGIAGIARETTSEEDENIKQALLDQHIQGGINSINVCVKLPNQENTEINDYYRFNKFKFEAKTSSTMFQINEILLSEDGTEYKGPTYFSNSKSNGFIVLFSDGSQSNFIGSSDAKWGGYTSATGATVSCTFDSNVWIAPDLIKLKSANDTASNTGRTPASWKLYGYHNGEWILIHESNSPLGTDNNTWYSFTVTNRPVKPIETKQIMF